MTRFLPSPNAWLWKSWRVKQRERQAWEQQITVSVMQASPKIRALAQVFSHGCVRIDVERQVARVQGLIRDDDNLAFAVKPLQDALKRAGLIHDDDRQWIDQATTQLVALDGQARTIVTLTQIPHTKAALPVCRVHGVPIFGDMNGVPHCPLCRSGAASDAKQQARQPHVSLGDSGD